MNLDDDGFVADPDSIWLAQQRAMQTVDCVLCDDHGYRGGQVCDHVDRTVSAARGIALVRQTMGWVK